VFPLILLSPKVRNPLFLTEVDPYNLSA